jgi:Rrf2 family protein
MAAIVKISSRCVYALEAMLELARQDDGDLLRVSEIAEAAGIPKSFLRKILQSLCDAGLIKGTQGRSGGFTLMRPPESIGLGEIMAAVCEVSSKPPASTARQSRPAQELLAEQWKQAGRDFQRRLNQLTLAKALKELDEN